ncbi:glucosyl-3-phosphoglycerate synthase [Sulfuriroseicoccus oceanibius]|uniref:Glucosyl-3-phosphoglycerate synthase n=1 Tax=Sulfuriroseicoccus oceanibius TaxID=2707525 RepID=A0A6B3LE92_9BACT|nr:glucosyl-3-phosphoglycerate synthase [Sulfuriroseicoccus oceanibius]QQL44678.1 glucosyl-3-phosphoglycerate synthase [Sulfuriroseicoccus oceanibius]
MSSHGSIRRFDSAEPAFSAAALVENKALTDTRISVAIPTLNEASTIGGIVSTIVRELMEATPLVDELLVVDSDSDDDTASIATAAGAQVLQASAIQPATPAVRGKGENLWRATLATTGDIVCFVDGDLRDFSPHFITGLIGPLLQDTSLQFVKATYHRHLASPFGAGEGGRSNALFARPLLALFLPELRDLDQPLGGEYAFRRDLLEALPFATDYGVEMAHLVDIVDQVGSEGIAQCDLGERHHRNRSLDDLAQMNDTIGRRFFTRLAATGRMDPATAPMDTAPWRPPPGSIACC